MSWNAPPDQRFGESVDREGIDVAIRNDLGHHGIRNVNWLVAPESRDFVREAAAAFDHEQRPPVSDGAQGLVSSDRAAVDEDGDGR